MANHPLRGAIFETYVLGEVIKHYANLGQNPKLSYLRESSGLEIDLIIEQNTHLHPLQIKSGQTFNDSWLYRFKLLGKHSADFSDGTVVYAGVEEFTMSQVKAISASHIADALLAFS